MIYLRKLPVLSKLFAKIYYLYTLLVQTFKEVNNNKSYNILCYFVIIGFRMYGGVESPDSYINGMIIIRNSVSTEYLNNYFFFKSNIGINV